MKKIAADRNYKIAQELYGPGEEGTEGPVPNEYKGPQFEYPGDYMEMEGLFISLSKISHASGIDDGAYWVFYAIDGLRLIGDCTKNCMTENLRLTADALNGMKDPIWNTHRNTLFKELIKRHGASSRGKELVGHMVAKSLE